MHSQHGILSQGNAMPGCGAFMAPIICWAAADVGERHAGTLSEAIVGVCTRLVATHVHKRSMEPGAVSVLSSALLYLCHQVLLKTWL